MTGGTDCKGNNHIYPVMDWENEKQTFRFCVLQGIFASFIYIATYGLCKLRFVIHQKTIKTTERDRNVSDDYDTSEKLMRINV